jgi:hypothetical protein
MMEFDSFPVSLKFSFNTSDQIPLSSGKHSCSMFEVQGSNLCTDTEYAGYEISCFRSLFMKTSDSISNWPRPLPSIRFPITYQLSIIPFESLYSETLTT